MYWTSKMPARYILSSVFLGLTHPHTLVPDIYAIEPGHHRRQAIIWTNAGIMFIWPLWTNFREILIKIQNFPFTKMHSKCRMRNGGHFVQGYGLSQFLQLSSLWWLWEYMYFIYYHDQMEGQTTWHFGFRSWNNGMRCMSFFVLIMTSWHGNTLRITRP